MTPNVTNSELAHATIEDALAITVIICCHNGAARLPCTLAALSKQRLGPNVPWEVIVVDNASTDETASVAYDHWPSHAPAPLRVLREGRLGLNNARECGFEAARYEIVVFVDDDNSLTGDWLETALKLFQSRSEVGAVGGRTVGVFETPPSKWLEAESGNLAVGRPFHKSGPLPRERYLYGAGLCVRKRAWQQLRAQGFRCLGTDRQGTRLTSAGDVELCFALQLAGWTIWYEDSLVLEHHIPTQRCSWSYFRRLFRGHGISSVILDPYYRAFRNVAQTPRERLRTTWWWRLAGSVFMLISRPSHWIKAAFDRNEGSNSVLALEYIIGRVGALIALRNRYDEMFAQVEAACLNKNRAQHLSVLGKADRSDG